MRLTHFGLALAATISLASAQMPSGPGSCGPCAPCGPSTGGPAPTGPQTIMIGPGDPDMRTGPMGDTDPDRPTYRGPDPSERYDPLADQAQADGKGLTEVLQQLNPAERAQLDQILSTYQQGMNGYIQAHPRAVDMIGANGTVMNIIESARSSVGLGTNERGCDPISTQAGNIIAPLTGPGSSWRVHEYEYVPSPDATVGDHMVTLGGAVAGGAVIGSAAVGPWGTVGGAAVGGATWAINSFEHNMVVLVNTRDPNLRIVLDPHGAQSGNMESVHGPGHYSGARVDAQYRPPAPPAAAQP